MIIVILQSKLLQCTGLRGRLALLAKNWPHYCETGVQSLAGCSLEQGTSDSAHGPMLLLPAVAQKLWLRFVQLCAVSRCCIVFVCQQLTMPHLLWFTCRDCARLSAINKHATLRETSIRKKKTGLRVWHTSYGSATLAFHKYVKVVIWLLVW